jgi:hypothetical protein
MMMKDLNDERLHIIISVSFLPGRSQNYQESRHEYNSVNHFGHLPSTIAHE